MQKEKIRIVEPPKDKFTWVKELLKTPVGEKFKSPKKFKKSLSSIASRDVKIPEPSAEFTIDSKSDPKYIIVERTA